MTSTFPKQSVVYRGCVLAVIVNAIRTTEVTMSSNYDQWCEDTYLYDGVDGNYAAVAFGGDRLVGILFDHDSDRSPFRCEGAYDLKRFFRGMPAGHRPLLERCFTYWIPYYKGQGQSVQPVTAAFWDEGEHLTAAEPWEQVWEHGAHVISTVFIEDREEAIAEQAGSYLSPAQASLARSLFERKMAQPAAVIEMTPADMQLLQTHSEGPAAEFLRFGSELMEKVKGWPPAIEAGRQIFESIGIRLPVQKPCAS